jgi:hypothetical protein
MIAVETQSFARLAVAPAPAFTGSLQTWAFQDREHDVSYYLLAMLISRLRTSIGG